MHRNSPHLARSSVRSEHTYLCWGVLAAAAFILLCLAERRHRKVETWKLFIDDRVYAPLDEHFDCTAVWFGLRRLFTATLERRSAFAPRGVSVTDGLRDGILDIHVLFLGDSWAQRAAWAASRAVHLCRRQLPTSTHVADVDCGLSYGTPEHIHDVMYLSLSVLNLSATQVAALRNESLPERIRLHTHYKRRRFLVDAAQAVAEDIYGVHSRYANGDVMSGVPMLQTTTFPPGGHCASPLRTAPYVLSHQLPWCPCEMTIGHPDDVARTVPLAAVQVFSGMWDTHRPELLWDLFSFHEEDVDWFAQQAARQPDLSHYPHITWEDNLARFRAHLLANFTRPLKAVVAHVAHLPTAGAAVSAPVVPPSPLLLSLLPPVNCSAPKFYRLQGRRTVHHCVTLLHAIQKVIDTSIEAVFSASPGDSTNHTGTVFPFLRRVEYHRGLYPDVCTMSDGVHLDTAKLGFSDSAAAHRCSAKAHLLFWENV